MQELERCEKMLHAQTNINRELALEIEELTTQKVSSSSQLQRRMKDLELLCEERQQRIHHLEAEIRQLKYARERLLLKSRDIDEMPSDGSSSDDENSEAESLSESLVLAARDLAPGEQLLELGIVNANFDRSAVGVNSSTFVLCDFYDFESQSTPLLMGNRPEYNLSATFKVTVDGFFLRYLASECIALEVYQAVRGDFKLIGTASVRLSKLLHSKGVIKEPVLPVKSTSHSNDGESIALGTLNVILRLSTPISEVWRLHLRSYPQDVQLLSTRSKGNNAVDSAKAICEADFTDDNTLPVDELQVTVFACRNLRSYGEKHGKSVSRIPSSYAHYQLLGFPDIFTNIVPESSNPEYDLECSRQTFVLEVDACLLRFFSKFCFWITVFDDQAELEDNADADAGGMIGRCGLMLSDLVNGECVRGWFPLKDQNGRHAGDISILIQWKDPFQVLQLSSSQRARGVNGRPIDLHSLDFDQQHALLAMFSPEMDGRVNYRQFLHYAVPSEELELIAAKIKERFEYAIDSEQIACIQDALYEGADPRARKSMLIRVDTLTKAMEKHGVFLTENELTFLMNTFGILDLAAGNQSTQKDVTSMAVAQQSKVMMHYLLLHINPRLSCVERLMCHKIRQTVRGYLHQQRKRKDGKAMHPAQLFEKFDEAKCGRITRSEFRKCLSALGFDLLNVEAEYRELVRTHTKPPSPVSNGEGAIENDATQPIRDGIDLDEDVLVDSKTSAARQIQQTLPLGGGASSEKRTPRKRNPTLECAMVESTANGIPAATEFQRRKQAFMDRMKAIASASSKNLVYEQLEKKQQQQQLDVEKQKAALSRQNVLQQELERLHTPQAVHQNAARALQKQYRQHKEQQHNRRETNLQAKHTIIEADLQLQNLLKKWTSAELNKLENELLCKIETDIPEAKQTRVVSKKQLGYLLSQIPRIALPPALLAQLMDYFSVEQRGFASQVAYEAFLNFLCSTSTEETEHEKQQRQVVLKVLGGLCVDVDHATQTFASVGDMNNTGCISFKKFRESLTRIGVHLTAKDVHLVMIMFDTNGFQLLYHAFLHTLQHLPQSSSLVQVLKRCQRFGVSTLREKLLVSVNTEDGLMTKHDLHHVLMEEEAQSGRFEPQDASVLFAMVTGSPNSGERVSIQELCLRLEKTATYSRPALNGWNKYDLGQLQRLAWNCRKLLCGSHSDLMSEFERFDWKEGGVVARTEFVTATRRNGFVVFTDEQLNEIAKTFGTKTGSSFGVDYGQFLDWTTPPPPMQMDNIEAKLRAFAQTQADKSNMQLSEVVTRWKEIFSAEVKPSQTGGIDRAHFVKICTTKLGLALNDAEVRTVLYTYDRQLEDEVDYNAFLLMNWKKTATTSRKVMQLDSKPTSDRDIVANIKEKLRGREGVKKEIAEAFSHFGDVDQPLVEEGNFLLAMKRMGVLLSPDDVRALFSAFGVDLEKRRLNYVRFFKDSLDLPLTDVVHRRPEHQLSPESETRLKCALEAAGTYSLPAFQIFFVHFQEFCVVRQFADIPPTNFWHEMKTNGLVDLLSKKGVGLLAQKFSITCCEVDDDDDDSADDADVNVSLKAVHAYLRGFLERSTSSAQVSRKQEVSRQSVASSKGATSTRSPIGVLSQLVDWCDEQGIDFRGEFETYDRVYAGFTPAMEFKQVLLRLGIEKIAAPLAPEAVIGQLVRQFRSPEVNDAVQYTAMLHEVTMLEPNSAQAQWYGRISEHLRSRIRVKANLVGKIDPSDTTNYSKLDASFSHFDREKKGFLTMESLQSGLHALKYELNAEQRNMLMTHMSIFRHGGGGLSRTEFDSFVLDPYGFRLVKKLSGQLYSRAQQHQTQEAVPRIAVLSRHLMESGGSHHERSLPREVFWSQLEHALERHLTTKEKFSLQHLFDVNRDGEIAYKLFLKVISQWRMTSGDPVSAVEGPVQQGARVQTIRTSERTELEEKPTCPRDAILHSLHNQMSSIDFASQVDIVEEYLRRKDRKRTGAINMKKLKQIFNQIGLSLSADAFTSLQMYFPGSLEAKEGAPREASVSYEELLAALKKLHRESEDIPN
ncbi:hypothetical protein BBJ28_00007221 [Nothophytophthora sp. Chile5]|nr:hypothetical protein BBJ28_00007221 [Nothophytophthora sp. Chile5]